MGDSGHQCVYIAINPVQLGHLGGYPVWRQAIAVSQFPKDAGQQTGMYIRHGFPEIRYLADVP